MVIWALRRMPLLIQSSGSITRMLIVSSLSGKRCHPKMRNIQKDGSQHKKLCMGLLSPKQRAMKQEILRWLHSVSPCRERKTLIGIRTKPKRHRNLAMPIQKLKLGNTAKDIRVSIFCCESAKSHPLCHISSNNSCR